MSRFFMIPMGLKLFLVLSIFLFVASASPVISPANPLNKRGPVTCFPCAITAIASSGTCAIQDIAASTWDCSVAAATNPGCTKTCTGCYPQCASATEFTWACDCS
ncbi:367_t:CDS:2 [Entrophospora sp. SA101]|nr:367_t:CDS:2 [Entrophospora sp. SA101]CAJ0830708.1 11298_t:CDS:2 [Entrophospora sp. SA101]